MVCAVDQSLLTKFINNMHGLCVLRTVTPPQCVMSTIETATYNMAESSAMSVIMTVHLMLLLGPANVSGKQKKNEWQNNCVVGGVAHHAC